jgi:hypothetical protein
MSATNWRIDPSRRFASMYLVCSMTLVRRRAYKWAKKCGYKLH